MRDFHEYLQAEGWFGDTARNIVGHAKDALGMGPKPWQPPEPIPQQFYKYWVQLVAKHGGNNEAAWEEYQQLKSSPAGQYKMQRMNAMMDPRTDPSYRSDAPTADYGRGGSPAMYKPRA